MKDLIIDKGYWYLASPYSRYEPGPWLAWTEISRIALRLTYHGVVVYAPISHSHSLHTFRGLHEPDVDWLAIDKHFVDLSHGLIICTMDGWEESSGVKKEIGWFKESGKPMFTMDPVFLAHEPFTG